MIDSVLKKIQREQALTREDAQALLQIPNGSPAYYQLLALANQDARRRFQQRGVIFAQIGMDASPCPVNCGFCSLAQDVFAVENSFVLPVERVVALTQDLVAAGIDELFLMTTANFDPEEFLAYGRQVKQELPPAMRFVANVGDFDLAYARRLKETGFTGVYHIHRLGEGRDTQVEPATRLQTLAAIRDAGLELYYCVEPIGPEHTPAEICDEIFRVQDYPVHVMAVMKRVCVPGTRLADRGEISAAELAKICAVTELCVRPDRAMGVHEPDELCLMAGANQIYAEVSINPRDVHLNTEESRGCSVERTRQLLRTTEWQCS